MNKKRCPKCKQEKDLAEFNKNKSAPDGLQYNCKSCIIAYRVENRQKIVSARRLKYAENKDVERSYSRVYRENNLEKEKERNRKYYLSNKSKKIASNIAYKEKNRELLAKKQKAYKKTPDGMIAATNGKIARRARKANSDGKHTIEEFKQLCSYYGNICLCCGKAKKLTEDHIIPLSKGGDNWLSNIQPLCHSCNSRKRNTHYTDYRKTSNNPLPLDMFIKNNQNYNTADV